ncbi:Response regulator, putative [Penicillium digitatum]|uniref:Response regulator, putative n=3 Tax=Penicillium digitatum TaxID=36651 RepID=K9GMZ5_PEND2|nr:Response regulator, putative [Penicillium digitatum Pd1]EKV12602.1 Response regulator, putative [Penicillium digitatum Pd1]EKV14516.1 Response regulator, putative [Penicillium digitatum PHI26]QQK43256.1 Response regulator, putative [Penicillium digitatum]
MSRISRLKAMKAKLLGRLSPKAGADPSAHSNQKHSGPLVSNKSPAYSIVSSNHLDEISTSRNRPIEEIPSLGPNKEPDSSVCAPSEQPHHLGTRNCTPSTEHNNSSLPTPILSDLSPLETPQHSDSTSFQSVHVKAQTPIPAETQLTPTPNTVPEWPTNDRRPSASYFPPSRKRPSLAIRRQSLLPATHHHLISGLLEGSLFSSGDQDTGFTPLVPREMVTRRIWVKRPGGSATLVPCREDAVVDELRDQVIMKYGNSLGRSFDSPDIAIRVTPREGTNRPGHSERLLSPEELLSSILDTYYPGGQKIEEALVIDAPSRRTPKPSPRHSIYQHHYSEPGEHGDYFPLMPPVNAKAGTPSAHAGVPLTTVNAPSISILNTGVAPLLPSPGSRRARHQQRPPLTRHKTNSPTILHNQNPQTPVITETGATPHSQPIPAPSAPAIPTPPVVAPPVESPQVKSHTPPATASPRVVRKSKAATSPGAMFGGLIDGTVPPINVLIVEDNIINQKLLEAFMKRLKVRWKCAMNGEEAVRKWRQGGFHLVLMDIQLPVMNGLEATKEIRRLERLNGIGVFPKTASGRFSASNTSAADRRPGLHRTVSAEDTLPDLSLFRSPVIIVALTASSLQSDRHEALAAGCNDFLTKPVGFPWLEQKVTEWGCMQALIDFEGWRKWRGFLDSPRPASPAVDTSASPMQGGYRKEPHQVDPPSPSSSRSNKPDLRETKPSVPGFAQILREDSWGSGSPDSLDSLSSPQFPTPGDAAPISDATAAPPNRE